MKKNESLFQRILNAFQVLGFFGILKLVKTRIELSFLSGRVAGSHSQLFEDYYLYRFLDRKDVGFYVDIGANDPNNLNNTAFFYEKGWIGMNIEPDTEKHRQLQEARPKDQNINMGVGSKEGLLEFYRFENDSLSTFVKEEADRREAEGEKLVGIANVAVDRLSEVLKAHLSPATKRIDFMSVDVEGLNLEVLESNDWEVFRPKFLCVEVADYCQNQVNRDRRIVDFLQGKGYSEVFFNGINSIFVDTEQ